MKQEKFASITLIRFPPSILLVEFLVLQNDEKEKFLARLGQQSKWKTVTQLKIAELYVNGFPRSKC